MIERSIKEILKRDDQMSEVLWFCKSCSSNRVDEVEQLRFGSVIVEALLVELAGSVAGDGADPRPMVVLLPD